MRVISQAAVVVALIASLSALPATAGAQAYQVSMTLSLHADSSGALKFDRTKLSAKAGKVTLKMVNKSSTPHNIALKGKGVNKVGNTVENGGVSTVSATLKKGRYTFYCDVDHHASAGMRGTLVVK